MNNKTLYYFDDFRVDTDQRCLWRGEDLVSLTPKAFETLIVLIKNKGNVVSKDRILDEVWKDTFVEEATLAQNISTLRKTLAKYEKGKEFIITIPRRGYRFVADVTESLAEEEVLVVEKRSVTHIVAEQEQIDDSEETAISTQTKTSQATFINNKILRVALPIALLTILVVGVASIYFLSSSESFYNSKFQKFQVNNLFSSKYLVGVTSSPDGKYIAFVERKSEGDSISLKQIESGNRIEILPKSNLIIVGITFSPKSNLIYYSAYKKTGPTPKIGSLYKLPLLGGAPEEILKDIDSPVAISPDDKKIAFIRNKLKEKQSVLVISNKDGSNEKELVVRELGNGFSRNALSWSPDSRLISTVLFDVNDEKQPAKLVLVNSENGEQQTLTNQNWIWIGSTAWLKDGSGITFVAYGSQSPNITDELWFVSYPDGKERLISNGIKGLNGFSVSDEANSIVATKSNRITSSYIGSIEDLDNAEEIAKTIDDESLAALGADWINNDEKIVYSKTNNGNADLWVMSFDGTEKKQLTSDKSADYSPIVSPNGKFIFFLSNRSGSTNIWRINMNGENPTEIIKAKGLFAPTLSPDNKFIYYSALAPNKSHNVLWKSDFDGKNVKQLTSVRTYGGKIAPNGKYIACFFPDTEEDPDDITKPLRITILSLDDGKIIKQFAPLKSRTLPNIEWKSDSESFLILERERGKSNLYLQNIDSDEPKLLKTWKDENIYQIAISGDGEKLFFDKGKEVNSVVQFKDISTD